MKNIYHSAPGSESGKPDSVDVLGVRVDCVSPDDILNTIAESIAERRRTLITYVHLHAVNLAQNDRALREIFRTSVINYCDGEGVRWGARLLGRHIPYRIPLTRWIYSLLRFCENRMYSVYFLGSEEEAAAGAAEAVRAAYPSLSVAGCHNGYFHRDRQEEMAVIDELWKLHPDIVLVGMGMPWQEIWIRDHWDRLPDSVILTAGSCLEYVAGMKPACPAWLADNGLEWFHRLLVEPRKVWRRYLLGIPLFFLRILSRRLFGKNG